MIEFVKPTLEMVEAIAADMRDVDAAEVWASSHHTPLQSLMASWELSDFAAIATHNGEPLVMLGIVKRDILSGSGVVWMLGCNAVMKHRKQLLSETKPLIEEMLTICPRLCNMVHSKNTSSITWLKWLGFTIDEPVPYGYAGELFHPFHLEVSQYV